MGISYEEKAFYDILVKIRDTHEFEYPNEIGPGVYDIHSARVPSVEEIVNLMEKAKKLIPAERLWVNPDCGLKTRGWDETRLSLINMVKAAVFSAVATATRPRLRRVARKISL